MGQGGSHEIHTASVFTGLSVVSAIAIAVTITVTASRPAAASSGIAEPAAVPAPAVPDSTFVAGAARRGHCDLTCHPDKDNKCTKILIKHCDGRDDTGARISKISVWHRQPR